MDDSNDLAPKARRGTRTRAATKVVSAPPPSQAELLPWQHNNGENYRLVISEQPEDEFYKDQGGKNHHLSTTLRLVPESEVPTLARSRSSPGLEIGDLGKQSTIEIPLKTTLLYENGVEVEEQTKNPILKPMIKDDDCYKLQLRYSSVRNAWAYEGEVKFRLEKVSLRCDGKKFKLAIDLDTDPAALQAMEKQSVAVGGRASGLSTWVKAIAAADPGGVETVGINVLSKKKSNHVSHTPTRHNDDAATGTTRPRSGSISRGGGSGGPQKRQRTGAGPSGQHDAHSPVNDTSALTNRMYKLENLLHDVLNYVKVASERMNALDEKLDSVVASVSVGGGGGGGGVRFSNSTSFNRSFSRGDSVPMVPLGTRMATDQDQEMNNYFMSANGQNSSETLPLPLELGQESGIHRQPSWALKRSTSGDSAAADATNGTADATNGGPGLAQPKKLQKREASWGPDLKPPPSVMANSDGDSSSAVTVTAADGTEAMVTSRTV